MTPQQQYQPSDKLANYLDQIKSSMDALFVKAYSADEEIGSIERTYEVMRYMVFLDGKRIRPALTMLASDACGGDPAAAWSYAQAVEEIHTYTLILDDIQDESNERRGQPTAHCKFDVDTAMLAAMRLYERGLVPYHTLGRSRMGEARKLLDLLHRGQAADLAAKNFRPEDFTPENIRFIHGGKTSALLQLALLGGLSAAGAGEKQTTALLQFGYYLGLAFQCRDDVLGATADAASLGKPAGATVDTGKLTYVQLFGSALKAQEEAENLARKASDLLQTADVSDVSLLNELTEFVVRRWK